MLFVRQCARPNWLCWPVVSDSLTSGQWLTDHTELSDSCTPIHTWTTSLPSSLCDRIHMWAILRVVICWVWNLNKCALVWGFIFGHNHDATETRTLGTPLHWTEDIRDWNSVNIHFEQLFPLTNKSAKTKIDPYICKWLKPGVWWSKCFFCLKSNLMQWV